jgi:hypothetical protein
MADPDEAERTRSHSTALKRPRSPAGAGAGAAHSAESKKRKRAEPPAALPVSMSTSRRHDRSGGGDDEEVKSSQQPMARRQRQPRGEIAPSVTQGACPWRTPLLCVMSQFRVSSSDAPYTLCSRDTMASDGVLQVAGFQGDTHTTHAHARTHAHTHTHTQQLAHAARNRVRRREHVGSGHAPALLLFALREPLAVQRVQLPVQGIRLRQGGTPDLPALLLALTALAMVANGCPRAHTALCSEVKSKSWWRTTAGWSLSTTQPERPQYRL